MLVSTSPSNEIFALNPVDVGFIASKLKSEWVGPLSTSTFMHEGRDHVPLQSLNMISSSASVATMQLLPSLLKINDRDASFVRAVGVQSMNVSVVALVSEIIVDWGTSHVSRSRATVPGLHDARAIRVIKAMYLMHSSCTDWRVNRVNLI